MASSGSMGLSSIFHGYFLNRYSIKGCLLVSTFGYCLNLLSGCNLVFCAENQNQFSFNCERDFISAFSIITSIISGILSGLIWVAQPAYISGLLIDQPEERGRYYGTFSCIFKCNAILGNTFTMLLLKMFGRTTLYFTMTILSMLSIILFYFISPVPKVK